MVALNIRCVLFLAAANAILVEVFGNEDVSQEEEALQQAMALVHMLRSDYIKVMKEKQVLTDTLAVLMQQMSKSQPSSTDPQLKALEHVSAVANTENWLNSSATVVASSTSSAPHSTTRMDIPQRRFMQNEPKTNLSTANKEGTETPNGTTKKSGIKPAPKVPRKSAQKSVARKPVKQSRSANHQAVTKHFARTSEHKRGDFWRHLSTTTAPTIKAKDPVLGQIARELINEFQHGNTETLKQLKHKILLSRARKSRRDGDDAGIDNAADNAATDNPIPNSSETITKANSAEATNQPPGNNETNTDLNNEESANGEPISIVNGSSSQNADVSSNPFGISISTRHSPINAHDLRPTTHPMPTYRSSLKLYLGRSSRLPTPLPKNNAYCFWEPKSPLCGLSI